MKKFIQDSLVNLDDVHEVTIRFRPNEDVTKENTQVVLDFRKDDDYEALGPQAKKLIYQIFNKRINPKDLTKPIIRDYLD